MGNDNMAASPSGSFRTADGQINIAANKQEQYEGLCRAIDRADLITDPRFAIRRDRLSNRSALKAEIEARLAARSTAEWDAIFAAASVPEALAHPHIAAREFVQEFPGMPMPSGRPLSILRGGFRVNGQSPKVDLPPPGLDAHRYQILSDLAERKLRAAE